MIAVVLCKIQLRPSLGLVHRFGHLSHISTPHVINVTSRTHLEQLALLPALPAQIPERAILFLHQLPGRAEFHHPAMIQDEDPTYDYQQSFGNTSKVAWTHLSSPVTVRSRWAITNIWVSAKLVLRTFWIVISVA